MLQSTNGPTGSPARAPRARPRLLALARDPHPAPPPADAVVSDEQVSAFVAAADGLRRRQQERCADGGTAEADARLLRLDWAVRAGRLVLADRVAQGTGTTAGPAQLRQGQG